MNSVMVDCRPDVLVFAIAMTSQIVMVCLSPTSNLRRRSLEAESAQSPQPLRAKPFSSAGSRAAPMMMFDVCGGRRRSISYYSFRSGLGPGENIRPRGQEGPGEMAPGVARTRENHENQA